MTTEALKSTAITNLDAVPVSRPNVGAGAAGRVLMVDGYLTSTTAKTSGSTYQMVRVPSNCKVKHLRAHLDAAATTFTCDIGAYYSSGLDTPSALRGTVIDADFFGSAVVLGAIINPVDYTFEATTYTAAKRQQPLWQALGLTSDPGGSIDIVLTNTATNSDAATVYMEVEYVV